jgi:hypothetical protein
MRKKRAILRNLLLVAALTVFLFGLVLFLFSRTETIRFFLKNINERSPWNIELSYFNWNLVGSRISAKDIHIINRKDGKEALIKNLEIHYRIWDVLRGKLFVRSLKIDNLELGFPQPLPKKKKIPGLFDITKILFLQNIILRHGIIMGMDVNLPGGVRVNADELRFSLKPTFLHETELSLRVDGAAVSRHGETVSTLAVLAIKASTSLPSWKSHFPYLNALSGTLRVQDAALEKLKIETIDAGLKYLDEDLVLEPFKMVIAGEALTGSVKADTGKESWQVLLEIPKPVALPYLVRQIKTFDTAGFLSGSLKAEGEGFVPSRSSGKAQASFTHRFSAAPERPLNVSAKAVWKEGVVDISDGRLSVENDTAKIDGSIDIVKKQINLSGSANNFPIEIVFDKFRNPKFKRIYGRSDVSGEFQGWGRKFHIKAKGTTHDGGYLPMVAERIETEIDATYDRLALDWKIYEKGEFTGSANLVVNLGPKISDEPRAKRIDLKVSIKNHPVAELLPGYGFKGLATGNVEITGPHLNVSGKAHVDVDDGGWFALSFGKASADLNISNKKIIFKNIRFAPEKIEAIAFAEPVVLDFVVGGIKLRGDPSPHLSIDMGYRYEPPIWQIHNVSYIDTVNGGRRIDVSGSVAKGGNINLKMAGSLDLNALVPLGFLVREAQGQADINLSASGPAKNPALYGEIKFNKCRLSPRAYYFPMENAEGKIKFEGHAMRFEDFMADVNDGNFKLNGRLMHSGLSISGADLRLIGKNMIFRTDDAAFRMEFDGDLSLAGSMPSPLLSGEINILEGKYSKDFNLLESITKKKQPKKEAAAGTAFSPRLDLRIKNSGDLYIKNNVGEIWMRADLDVKGTRAKPKVGGAVEVIEGEVHYLGINFDITRGFIEFRERAESPYMEVVAQKEINVYNVTIEVHGYTDNLAIDLSATSPTGPLDKRDVISLIAFGMTEREREQMEAQTGGQFGISMAAQQLTHVVEGPVKKFAHLDTFRLEASDPTSQSINRVSVGKQFSDRLNVGVTTDIDTKEAIQTIVGEYLITDNLLLKGEQSTDGRYRFQGVLRFRLR